MRICDHGLVRAAAAKLNWFDSWLPLLTLCRSLIPGLTHARWYDPATGQFISPDPIFDFPGNFGSPQSYVGQNPVQYTDPSGKSFDLNSQLNATAVSLQVTAIRVAYHAPLIGDILLGFVVDDPTATFTPLGAGVNTTKRAVIETVMHNKIVSEGFECVGMQFRSNGPGIDALYRKAGTSILDGAKNLFRVEYKVTGSGKAAQSLLGSASYGIQTSRQWDEMGYQRLMQASSKFKGMTWDKAIQLPKPINWTSLSNEELRFVLKNAEHVEKRLIGATVLDDATDQGGQILIQFKEFDQHYVGGMKDAPKTNLLQETRLEMIPLK